MGQEVAIFRQTAANLRKTRPWVLADFNFVIKIPQNRGFPAPNFVFWEENFPTRRKSSSKLRSNFCLLFLTTVSAFSLVVPVGAMLHSNITCHVFYDK